MWQTLRPVRTCQPDYIFTRAAEQQPSVWYEVVELGGDDRYDSVTLGDVLDVQTCRRPPLNHFM